jgi:ureidoglycolate lyase|tara:strand:- start:217 stop:762 length:546 start_codon:yes stop_codon:yes gene_type:complete
MTESIHIKEIVIEPLTRANFADFGDVIETESAKHFPINDGRVERYHDLASVQLGGENSRALINIFECNVANQFPYQLPLVERHPIGSQAFIPLTPIKFVVVVGKAGDHPQPEDLRAFESNGYQGINYHQGVWHMPLVADETGLRFLVVDRGGDGDNCDEEGYPDDQRIMIVRQPNQVNQSV